MIYKKKMENGIRTQVNPISDGKYGITDVDVTVLLRGK